jgi:hypothetical protein
MEELINNFFTNLIFFFVESFFWELPQYFFALFTEIGLYSPAYYLPAFLLSFSLVPWGVFGSMGSSFGRRWSTKERRQWTLKNVPPYLLGVIIGLILGDACIEPKGSTNALLRIEQSIQHFPYLLFVFKYLSPLCQSFPSLMIHVIKGVVICSFRITTRSLPFLFELRALFYPNGEKCIPLGHVMFQLLSPIALAHWIMCDGEARHSGLRLCTNSFSIPDVVKLMNILLVKYQLECTLYLKKQGGQTYPMIYIREQSMPQLQKIVLPYMDSSMLYKIGIKNSTI